MFTGPGSVHTVSRAARAAAMHPDEPPLRRQRRAPALGGGAASSSQDDDTDFVGADDASSAPRDPRSAVPETGPPALRAAAAASVKRAEAVRDCPLCWDEQPFLGRAASSSAMQQKVQDFRRLIFNFERGLSGLQNDEVIFRGMLDLRRLFIEGWLRDHGHAFTPWTMDMLRAHYDPVNGHRFDVVRLLTSELDDMRLMKQWTMEHGMFVDSGDGTHMFNLRAVGERLKITRHYLDAVKLLQSELQRRDAAMQTDNRQLIETVNAAVNRLTAANPAAAEDADDPLGSMFSVGGL